MNVWPLQAKANAAGIATATLPSLATGRRWTISFISIQTNSTAQTQALVLLNQQYVIGSKAGNFDSASGEPSITVTAKDTLQIQWTGADVGATCSANIWYDEKHADAIH